MILLFIFLSITIIVAECGPNEVECILNQQCIPQEYICDGMPNCMDNFGADELFCDDVGKGFKSSNNIHKSCTSDP